MSGPTVERIETTVLDVPLVRPHRFARTGMDAQPILLVRATARDSMTGTGEGVVPGGPWWDGESVVTTVTTAGSTTSPGPDGDERRRQRQPCAEAAVEVALHDVLWNLPLLPFMTISVTPLTEHPSALSANP